MQGCDVAMMVLPKLTRLILENQVQSTGLEWTERLSSGMRVFVCHAVILHGMVGNRTLSMGRFKVSRSTHLMYLGRAIPMRRCSLTTLVLN